MENYTKIHKCESERKKNYERTAYCYNASNAKRFVEQVIVF